MTSRKKPRAVEVVAVETDSPYVDTANILRHAHAEWPDDSNVCVITWHPGAECDVCKRGTVTSTLR